MRRSTQAGVVQHYLDDLAADLRFPPQEAAVVWDALDLPLVLQRQIRRSRGRGMQWRAWRNETRVWLAEAAVLASPDAISLLVVFYNNNGIEEAAGIWSRRPGGCWRLTESVEPKALWHRLQLQQDMATAGRPELVRKYDGQRNARVAKDTQ